MIITKHAEKRLRSRVGIPKKAVKRYVEIATTKGTPHTELKGQLKEYADKMEKEYAIEGSNYYVFGTIMFVCANDVLITVYPLRGGLT